MTTETNEHLELSDDRKRGERPEIRAAIANVRLALAAAPSGLCTRCRRSDAVAVIRATTKTPKAICASCANAWRSATPAERQQWA